MDDAPGVVLRLRVDRLLISYRLYHNRVFDTTVCSSQLQQVVVLNDYDVVWYVSVSVMVCFEMRY